MIPESVKVTENIQATLSQCLESFKNSKIGVIVDENTEKHCLPLILDTLPEHWLLRIRSGEEQKNLDTCVMLWSALTEAQFGRKDLVINLGGGVIGDMGGFVASTYKRGMDFINIPTTLLSHVDASIGGKLGIDFQGLKNHIGVFNDPYQVLVSPQFLKSLPERELRSGFAEILKHGMIADASYYNSVTNKSYNDQDWMNVIRHSIAIKGKVVTEDPKESGLRKILNFGHTLGHAIETHFLDTADRLLHGEAIAIGMIMEAFLSYKFSGLSESHLNQISKDLVTIYQPSPIDEKLFERIIQLTGQDKKNADGQVNYSLLKDLGDCGFDFRPGNSVILDSMFYYNQLVR